MNASGSGFSAGYKTELARTRKNASSDSVERDHASHSAERDDAKTEFVRAVTNGHRIERDDASKLSSLMPKSPPARIPENTHSHSAEGDDGPTQANPQPKIVKLERALRSTSSPAREDAVARLAPKSSIATTPKNASGVERVDGAAVANLARTVSSYAVPQDAGAVMANLVPKTQPARTPEPANGHSVQQNDGAGMANLVPESSIVARASNASSRSVEGD
eukprot:2937525-Amphidinium_carterae.1